LNDYARPMPYLGYDPAPGDVGLTQDLARRHYQVAQETRQVLTMVEQLDLTPWQGQSGDAMRALRAAFPPALRNAVSAAEMLQAATSSWAGQLSGFQAEADALERKAASASAHRQALQTQQAALPPSSSALKADLEAVSATLAAVNVEALELHQLYLAAAQKTAAGIERLGHLWDGAEPVRTVLEAVLAPLDIVDADHWVDALKKVAGVPENWVKQVDKAIGAIADAGQDGKSPAEVLIEAGYIAESAGNKIDAWYAFAPGWLKTAAGSLAEIKGFSYTLSGLGIAADVGTMISPQDNGGLGWADRTVAGVNGGLLAANIALDGLPVAGEVMLAATGAYLAGDFLYHHCTPFRDVANDVGHAVVTGVEGDVQLAKDAGHAVSSAWHSVTSSVGSWF
jgi:hypothetical protein